MQIAVYGTEAQQLALLEGRDWSGYELNFINSNAKHLPDCEILVHLDCNPTFGLLERLFSEEGKTLVVNSLYTPLAVRVIEVDRMPSCNLLGINAWPDMLKRTHWEVSAHNGADTSAFDEVLAKIGVTPVPVADEVGLVTGRILAMIINEAYFMLEEGTATMADIDNAMRLGVNYPYGPFEWAQRIGIDEIYRLLEALGGTYGKEKVRVARALRDAYIATQLPPRAV